MTRQSKLVCITALAGLLLVLPAPSACGSNARLVLPFDSIHNQIVLRLSLNGMPPGNFILDSGSESTVLDRKSAAAAHLKIVPNIGNAFTLGGVCSIGFSAEGMQIKYRRFELSRGVAPVIDLTGLAKGLGFPIEGIIGFNYIRQFPLLLDYRAKTITIFADKEVKYRGAGIPIPVVVAEGSDGPPQLPVVAARLELPDGSQADANLEIDTGYYGALDLHGPFVRNHPSVRSTPNSPLPAQPGYLQGGCGEWHKELPGQISAIALGGRLFPGPRVLYATAPAGVSASSQTDGELGNEFLSQFRVFFDIPRGQIVLGRIDIYTLPPRG